MGVPKLRFREFVEEWGSKKLGEIATFSKGKGISKLDTSKNGKTECIRYGELYTLYNEVIQIIHTKTDIAINNLVLSQYGDIIIPSSGESAMDIAKASCVLKDNVALGGDLNIIKTKHNGVFLSYYMNNAKRAEIAKMAQGISVFHLYSNQLKNLKINLPTPKEQQKIASFLNLIDKNISLHEQKLSLLKLHKKGVMQNIFSGTIRFKDKNGEEFPEWEEKKLGDVLEKPKQLTVKDPQNIELLTVQLHCKGIKKSGKFPRLTKNGRPYYQRYENELLIGRQNFHNGGIGIVSHNEDGLISSNAITSYIAKNNHNIFFIFCYISRESYYKKIEDLIGGTGQKEISKQEFNNLKIKLPHPNEQQKIANFLSSLDKNITLHEQKLSNLKNHKKALLQKMFV